MLSTPQIAVLATGCTLSVCSLICSLAGTLELAVILGPVGCITTWVWANVVCLLAWLPVLGTAAWQLSAGWNKAAAFVALGAIFITFHILITLAYWVRRTLRKREQLELPTTQLLTEAHRMMMTGTVDVSTGLPALVPAPHGTSSAGGVPEDSGATQFALQVGRSDGVAGLTLFIPAEAEEAALAAVAAKHYQQRLASSMSTGAGSMRPTRNPSGSGASNTPGTGRNSSAGGAQGSLVRQPSGGSNTRDSITGGLASRASLASVEDVRSSRSSLPTASSARITPSRGTQVSVPELMNRFTSGRQHRYRALEGAVLSPAASLRVSADVGASGRYMPPVHPAGRPLAPVPAGTSLNAAQHALARSGEQAVLVEGSNPLHHEHSLRHMLPRMSLDGPLMPRLSTGSGTLTLVATPVAAPAASSSQGAGSGVATAQLPSSPLTPQRSHVSHASHASHSRRGSDVPATPLQQPTAGQGGLISGLLGALGAGSVAASDAPGSGEQDAVLSSRVSLFGASGEANTSHHATTGGESAVQGSGASGHGELSGSASRLTAVALTPIQTGLVSPGLSARASLERSGQGAGGSKGQAGSKGSSGQGGTRRSHVRTHSLPLAPSLTMALLDEQDSSAELSSATPSPTGGQLT